MHAFLSSHPLSVDPLALLQEGHSLETAELDAVCAWADAVFRGLPPDTPLHRPSGPLTVLRGLTTSLTTLAASEAPALRAQYTDYEDAEHVVPAAVFLALELVIRVRETAEHPLASDEQAKAIGKARGWTQVTDVTADLLTQESRLVEHGAVVLRRVPDLRARWLADDARRTYDDTMGDLQRRLDFIADPAFALHFARAQAKTTALVTDTRGLMTDANRFRQSREQRLEHAVAMTRRRNVLFTLLAAGITNLQEILTASLADQPDKLARVEGRYWWNLVRYGRPAGTTSSPDPSDAPEPTDAPAPTDEPAPA